MRALTRLFGRSPFAPLRTHMHKVAACVERVPALFDALEAGKPVEGIAKEISKLEHEADLTKNDIRTGLKSHLFLPVDRGILLEALGLQDDIADTAEDIAVIFTLRTIEMPQVLKDPFKVFLNKNLEAVAEAVKVVDELTDLAESTFLGGEVTKLHAMVDKIAYQEHEADKLQREVLRILLNLEQELSYAAFYLWIQITQHVGNLSNFSEKLSNRILMAMEMK